MDVWTLTQGDALDVQVTLRDGNRQVITTYDGTQALAAALVADGVALAAPAAAWLTPSAGLVTVTTSATQSAGLAPRAYDLVLTLTDGGNPVEAYRAELRIRRAGATESAPGAAPAKPGTSPPAALATVYCRDEDLAARAPQDFLNLCPRWQRLAAGSDGVLAAGSWALQSATVDFSALGVAAGNVVALTRPSSAFGPSGELFAVDAVATGTVWLRRVGLAYGVGLPPSPSALTGVGFEVRTYARQIDNASFDANRFFGVDVNIQSRAPSQIYDLRELQQFTVLTVLRRAYIAADKAAAGDLDLKLQLVTQELEDLKANLTVRWGTLGDGNPPVSVMSSKRRR